MVFTPVSYSKSRLARMASAARWVSLLWSRCAGVRGLSWEDPGLSAAFVLADARGLVKVGAGVVIKLERACLRRPVRGIRC